MGESIMQGALIGLLVGVVMIGIFLAIALSRKPEVGMAARRTDTLDTPLAPADAVERIRTQAVGHGLKIAAEDPDGRRLVLSDGMTLFSFGMFYPVAVEDAGGGARITVGVAPRAPQWGPVIPHKLGKTVDKLRTMLRG